MNTRTRHSLSIDTIETLVSRRNGATWRAYAEQLGYAETYAATLNKAARGVPGAMTLVAENILRKRLGIQPRSRKRYLYLRFAEDERGTLEACAALRDALRRANA